ncbi:putative glutathione S-transferase, variant 2 [Stylosanthes scabra]|uniref:glutathione transferase n=1 Tax=Stylosanthes scabra TaxID=79078 RepID=A0ABU6VEI6_9FABA|nr:putative glutathione S-transferase, variant 2 [Stylosanthes scabra]
MAANQEDVKLLGVIASPFVFRVQLALKLKGVEYTFVAQDLKNKSEELLKYNPIHKKVPVLVHNGKPINESLVIVEYIDEAWKGYPILPTHPYNRALARFWANFIDDKVVNSSRKSVFTVDEEERDKNAKEAVEALQVLENEIKGRFFGGEELGFVDIAASFIAYWIPILQEVAGLQLFTSEQFPKLYKWIKNFSTIRLSRKICLLEIHFLPYSKLVMRAFMLQNRLIQSEIQRCEEIKLY